jgi:hypothetical protein
MYSPNGTSTQIFAVVGSAYISERHNDEGHCYLPQSDSGSSFHFDELLSKLRSAISLHRLRDV